MRKRGVSRTLEKGSERSEGERERKEVNQDLLLAESPDQRAKKGEPDEGAHHQDAAQDANPHLSLPRF